jgi:hypothetical protein
MTRLASIDVDAPIIHPAPARWSGQWVRRRLIEAYAIERRLPGERGHNGTAWPAILYEFADVVAWDDARERVLDAWANTRGSVFAREIARMDEAQAWLYLLAERPIERQCLAIWASAVAYRRSVSRLLASRRWARATFYRRVCNGSILIARHLGRNGVPVS